MVWLERPFDAWPSSLRVRAPSRGEMSIRNRLKESTHSRICTRGLWLWMGIISPNSDSVWTRSRCSSRPYNIVLGSSLRRVQPRSWCGAPPLSTYFRRKGQKHNHKTETEKLYARIVSFKVARVRWTSKIFPAAFRSKAAAICDTIPKNILSSRLHGVIQLCSAASLLYMYFCQAMVMWPDCDKFTQSAEYRRKRKGKSAFWMSSGNAPMYATPFLWYCHEVVR
jgi:hypothetical protein